MIESLKPWREAYDRGERWAVKAWQAWSGGPICVVHVPRRLYLVNVEPQQKGPNDEQ
jgi:hypothetical protein